MRSKSGILHSAFLVLVVGVVISVVLGLKGVVHPTAVSGDNLSFLSLSVEDVSDLESEVSQKTDCQTCCIEQCTTCTGFHHSPSVPSELVSAQVVKPIMISVRPELSSCLYRKPFLRPPISLV